VSAAARGSRWCCVRAPSGPPLSVTDAPGAGDPHLVWSARVVHGPLAAVALGGPARCRREIAERYGTEFVDAADQRRGRRRGGARADPGPCRTRLSISLPTGRECELARTGDGAGCASSRRTGHGGGTSAVRTAAEGSRPWSDRPLSLFTPDLTEHWNPSASALHAVS
jgi:hypothetical protein